MDRRETGAVAEALAADHLTANGALVLLRNYRRKRGELDLVARHGEKLLIVEVRCRSSERYGGAAASVDFRKQQRIVRAARRLLQERPDLARMPVRFDVIVVGRLAAGQRPRIEWITHAFDAA